jgi:hypothetical protein
VHLIGVDEVAGLVDFEFEATTAPFDFIFCYFAFLPFGLV